MAACIPCKKKRELATLPPPVEVSPESILGGLVELSQQDSTDVPKKKRGRPSSSNKATIKESTTYVPISEAVEEPKVEQPVYAPYPSVDELRYLDMYFGAKNKQQMYAEANRIYKLIFNEDLVPAGCRGCESRSWRRWIAWKGDILE